MKNRITTSKFLISCFIIFIGFTSCSKDSILNPDRCLNGSWIQEVEKELNAWVAATNTYGEDPTKANCEKYKSAGVDYLNALDKIKKCVPSVSLSEFNQAINEAKQELNTTSCQ